MCPSYYFIFLNLIEIKSHLLPDKVILSAQNVDLGNAREELVAEMEGEVFETGFNVQYFMDIIRHTAGDKLMLEMGDALDPCIVRVPDRDDCLFVVMPIRLD